MDAPCPIAPPEEASAVGSADHAEEGRRIGRYLVLQRLGAGGMGVVYAAYDPDLDRKVAVKVLHAGEGEAQEETRQRLLREAQAMARLSHPNVVAVHDVGTLGGQVYVAMDYVDGTTLREWLEQAPRSWREIIATFTLAGRGLAAAHAAGLVHRDFKPDNVLVGRDGGVRVTDFGLAREVTRLGDGEGPAGATAPAGPLGAPLTVAGAVMGTPQYMAPEQFEGMPTDQRTDVFSFSIALYEALYRVPPFAGNTLLSLMFNVTQGLTRSPPADSPVPRWLRHAVLRGLSAAPADRYSGMGEFLVVLARDPRRAQRRWAAALGGVALAALAALGYHRALQRTASLCQGAERRLDGVWGPAHKQAVRAALLGTGRSYAVDTWARLERALDQHTAAWVAMRTEACRATFVRGEQSQSLLDLRMRCLDRHLEDVRALTERLASRGGSLIEQSVPAAYALSSLSTCADAEALTAPVPPPDDAAGRARVNALHRELSAIRAASHTGQPREVLERARGAVREARAIGHPPAAAEALHLLGDIEQQLGETATAEQTLQGAALAAVTGRHSRVLAGAWTLLAVVVGYQQRRPEQGLVWAGLARAALDASGRDEDLRAQLLNSLGNILTGQRRHDEALDRFREALALHERLLGPDHLRVAYELSDMAQALREKKQWAAALAQSGRTRQIFEGALGPRHPQVATVLRNIALILRDQGRYDEAVDHLTRALRIWQEALGEEHDKSVAALHSLALVCERQGRPAEALCYHERVLALRQRAQPRDGHKVAAALQALGDALGRQGHHAEALDRHREALALQERAGDPVTIAESLTAVGEDLLGLREARKALGPLEQALRMCAGRDIAPEALARTRFALGRALAVAGRQPRRAAQLVALARDGYAGLGSRHRPDLAIVEAWLARAGRRL